MAISERNNESSYATNSKRSRSLNVPNTSNINSGNDRNNEELDIDLEFEKYRNNADQTIRVGNEYQAEIFDFCATKPAPADYQEKAIMVWTPYNHIEEEKLKDYVAIAEEKYNYNAEQALGILYWHDFNLQCALSDLPNYAPYPDEWTIEDKALFEQAYQFHNKNFNKYVQLLPDKKVGNLVKYYYLWKQRNKSKNSYVEKQVKKTNSQTKDEATDLMNNEVNSDEEVDITLSLSKDQSNERKECSNCSTKNANQYFHTKFGTFCKSCNSKRKNFSSKSNNEMTEKNVESPQNENDDSLSKINDSLIMNEDFLKEIAIERQTKSSGKVLDSYNNEIHELKSKIRILKQINSENQTKLLDLGDLPLLNQNNRIVSRWTNEEILLMNQAVREFGKDFKTIADIIGTKSEVQIKNYFLQNMDKLSHFIEEYNEENGIVIDETSSTLMNVEENGESKMTVSTVNNNNKSSK